MKIILFVIFAFFKYGFSLKCITCSGRDQATCAETKTIEDCSLQFKNPACVTLTYKEKLNKDKTVHTMIKKCSREDQCDDHCAKFWVDCKTKCCKSDLCNSGEQKTNQKTKRRIQDETSSSTIRISNISLFIGSILISIFYLKIHLE